MKFISFEFRKKFFKFFTLLFITIPVNSVFSNEFNPFPKFGNGFIKCDDGRFAEIPYQPHFFVNVLPSFYDDALNPSTKKGTKNFNNIESAISSVTSYIYPYKSIAIDKNWRETQFVNTEGAENDEYSRDWYSTAEKNDWFTADKLFKIYNLPTNNRTYKFVIFESNKIKKEPFSSNEKGQLKSSHTVIDLSHQNQEGQKLSMIILTKEPQKGDFYIKDNNGKIYEGYSKDLGNSFANAYGHQTGYNIKESIMCPRDLNKEIIIRNVFPLGIGITNLVGETKTKYVGLQVIETKLKTKTQSSTEKEFNDGFPSF